jgi:hypothetical protein
VRWNVVKKFLLLLQVKHQWYVLFSFWYFNIKQIFHVIFVDLFITSNHGKFHVPNNNGASCPLQTAIQAYFNVKKILSSQGLQVVMMHRVPKGYQCFGRPCYFCLQGEHFKVITTQKTT